MKLSVSLSDDDVAFLDGYARARGLPSRSAALHRAVALLRGRELEPAYAQAFEEWAGSEDAALWAEVVGDGLSREP